MFIQKLKLTIALWKGDLTIMVDVYVSLIVHGAKTIDQVPANLKAAVLAELAIIGIDGYGKPLIITQ